jgi:type IV pilus assembly protein PilV
MTAARTTSPSSSCGFTLVEVLMAMLIMTVGLVGLLQSLEVAYQHNARNRLREEGVLLAEEQMNVLRQTVFQKSTTAKRSIGGMTKDFSVTRQVQKINDTDSNRLTVIVGWTFKNATTKHVIYSMTSK